jgi:oligoendopeptidase F
MMLSDLAAVTWNLADLYETDETAREAMRRLAAEVGTFAKFTEDFGSSATALADALDARSRMQRQLQRILAYARLRTCEDARDTRAQALLHEATQLAADVREACAFVEPALVGIGADTIAAFVRAEPRLAVYVVYLADLARRADRVLSEREERLLAAARALAKSAYGAYHALVNVELPYPEITLSDGRRTRLNPVAYAELRGAPDQADRARVSTTFFTALGAYARTCGALMNASVQRAQFEAVCRRYASAFELALAELQVPDTLYTTLIAAVNTHLPVLHRYLTVRQRLLDLRQFHYHDLHAPLVRSDAHAYSLEQACQLVVTAMAPLGPGYVAKLTEALSERWVDFLPRGNKPSGAFTTGAAYDVHPYASLNFQGTWQDVSTLAHECGHVLHAAYTNAKQSFPLASLHPLVGELAATFNEGLLIRHMLDASADDIPRRIALLDCFLERIRTTVFRQVCFGEFELQMYAMAQNRAAITGESLSREYLALLRRYCGHDAGICIVDNHAGYEWIDIPHLRGMFSVLNYPVSFVAAFVLADRVYGGDTEARDAYLYLLGAGSSRPPLQLLADAGVDVQDPTLLDHVFARMDALTTEFERLA